MAAYPVGSKTIGHMRIIGGEFGGRRFNPPANIPARPTTELAKEGLFNILNNSVDLDGIVALDLFSGTGSIAYELLSRGAAMVTAIERDEKSFAFIKKTVSDLKADDRAQVIRADVFKYLKQCKEQYDIIFADPPYALANIDELPQIVFGQNLLLPGGTFVMEHGTRNKYEQHPNFHRQKNYGTSLFTIFTQPKQ